MKRQLLSALLLVACGSESGGGTPAPSTSPPARVESVDTLEVVEPPSEPASDVPSQRSDEVEGARTAYRAMVQAYGARDRAGYEGSFALTLGCFFGRADVERSVLMTERWPEGGPEGLLVAAELALVRHRPGEVYLFDRGFWRARTGRQVLHEKLVRMVRDGEQWRIAAETNREGTGCLPSDLELDVHFSADFAACRSAHERCLRASADGDARLACQAAALGCLGIGPDPAPSAAAPVTLNGLDAIHRLVRVSLAHELQDAGVSFEALSDGEELSDDDVEEDEDWRFLALLAVGAPRIRTSMGDTPASCGSVLLPPTLTSEASAVSLSAVRCSEDRQRCVAPLMLTGLDGTERSVALHLLFEGSALRVVRIESVASFDEVRELARFAGARPAAWDQACAPIIEALAERRVGEDFFVIENDEDIGVVQIHRACAAAAIAAVADLSVDWSCDGSACAPSYPCGNYCEALTSDGDRLLSVATGIDLAEGLSPASAVLLRGRVACDASITLELEALEHLGE